MTASTADQELAHIDTDSSEQAEDKRLAVVPMFVAELAMELLCKLSDAQLENLEIDPRRADDAADALTEYGIDYDHGDDDDDLHH